MSTTLRAALPRTDDLSVPPTYLQRLLAPLCRQILRSSYDVEVRGAEHFPRTGPVVVAANHLGWWDGPMMAMFSPRPVHALTKREMFEGPLGTFLAQSGQIPVVRASTDPLAVRTSVAVLRAGGCVGVFPEGMRGDGEMLRTRGGAAYLAMVTGAPVVPLAFVGTRATGGLLESRPPRGSRLVMAYGEPVHLAQRSWPRTRASVREGAELVRVTIRELLQRTLADTGLTMPGPPPDQGKERHDMDDEAREAEQ